MNVGLGTTLSHFRILAKIGEGGMGVVYRAEDEKLRRPVALKILPPDLVASKERRLRFLQEARAAAAVNHPNIATVYEVDDAEGVVFIAMELIEGKTLREVMGGKPMSIKEALRIATEMAGGLAEAHGARIIHRDFKPDNVIVAKNGRVKILDFGLAKLVAERDELSLSQVSQAETATQQLTHEGRLVGTAAYMSPEQARGDAVDARSDIFSFGITLYEMLGGKAPFRGRTHADILSSIIRDEPEPLSQLNTEVLPRMEEIIGKCLEKDRGERYQHTDDLVVDLRHLSRDAGPAASMAHTPMDSLVAAKPQRWYAHWATVLGSIISVLIALGLVSMWVGKTPPQFSSGDVMLVADLSSTTVDPDTRTSIQAAFELMLWRSELLFVPRDERRRTLIAQVSSDPNTTADRSLAQRLCDKRAIGGFVIGHVERDTSHYRIAADIYHCGSSTPILSASTGPHAEDELLRSLHKLTDEIRERLGETPDALATFSWPPTTDSLRAFHLMTNYHVGSPQESIGLCRRALEIDPDFTWAHNKLSALLYNMGELKEARFHSARGYEVSSTTDEVVNSVWKIAHLMGTYDFDAALELARTIKFTHPTVLKPYITLGWFPEAHQDLRSAIDACTSAYRIAPNRVNFFNLVHKHFYAHDAVAIERIADSHKASTGDNVAADFGRLCASVLRGDEHSMREVVRIRMHTGDDWGAYVASVLFYWLLRTGRLKEAHNTLDELIQIPRHLNNKHVDLSISLGALWLESRSGSQHDRTLFEFEELLRGDLLQISSALGLWLYIPVSALSIELNDPVPLERLIHELETDDTMSDSRFVREELAYARACASISRKQAQVAVDILKPLAQRSRLPLRHWALGRAYEQLGSWDNAARSYERMFAVQEVPWFFLVPLTQFRLAKIYDRLDDTDRAVHWYERFTEDWKDADPDIPELIEARVRLAELTAAATSSKENSDPQVPGRISLLQFVGTGGRTRTDMDSRSAGF